MELLEKIPQIPTIPVDNIRRLSSSWSLDFRFALSPLLFKHDIAADHCHCGFDLFECVLRLSEKVAVGGD